MSTGTARVIAAYEALPSDQKQEFVRELFHRLPPLDSGPLDDEKVALAGDQLAEMLEREEHDAQAR